MGIFVRKYKCSKCSHEFSKEMHIDFLRTILPRCPICGSAEIQDAKIIEKKERK